MPDKYANDSSGNTQAFRAFVEDKEAEPKGSLVRVVVAVAAAVVILVALAAWLALS
jgi:hypothetical protein